MYKGFYVLFVISYECTINSNKKLNDEREYCQKDKRIVFSKLGTNFQKITKIYSLI
jgi:hypothetical protein